MRKFTKCLMTLGLLLVAGVASAKEKTIYTLDYSTQADKAGAPFWSQIPDGATVKIENGLLVIDNTSDDGDNYTLQLHIASSISLQSTYSYKVLVTYKTTTATTDGTGVTVALGSWGGPAAYGQSLTVSNDWQVLTVPFNDYANDVADAFVMWQSRKLIGTISISKVEVVEIEPDVVPTYTDIITNGDLEGNDNVNFTVTEQGVGGPFMAKIQDGIGKEGSRGIAVQSSNDPTQEWDTQFFISVPKQLATGTKFKISFDCKASQAAVASTQWHNAPGSYVWWSCIGDVNFTTSWDNYEKTITVPKGDKDADIAPYTIAFNLAKTTKETTYYFDNIKLEVLDDQLAGLAGADALTNDPYPSNPAFTVGAAGYITFSYGYPVVFNAEVEAYAATYNAGGYVELTKLDGAAKNTAVILKAAAGDYTATVKNVAAPTENDLKVSDGNIEGDGTIYVLADKTNGVGFYKLATGDKVPAGKAYLTIGGAPAPDFLGFDGGTTSISELNVKSQADGEFYNLAGQRVAQPTKGLYIVNGKKVVIK